MTGSRTKSRGVWSGAIASTASCATAGPVGSREQPLIVERIDLPFEGAGRPTLRCGFLHVPKPGWFLLNLEEDPIVGPAQFRTQCVANRKGLVEDSHVSEVGCVETSAELPAEGFGQDWQQPSSIFGTSQAALLELDDVPTDLPEGLDLNRIDGSESLPASALN